MEPTPLNSRPGDPSSRSITLVVLAGGLGSRYGGLKQLDGVGPQGQIIMEYSIHDAVQAGFDHVVIIVGAGTKDEFRSMLAARLPRGLRVDFAVQDVHQLPEGFELPDGRTKPWGTAHAVLAARPYINGPFAVINADDFYGRKAFFAVADFLANRSGTEIPHHFAMVGYEVQNTVTEHGTVARGVCQVSPQGYLEQVVERTQVARADQGAQYSLDAGESWIPLPTGTLVSMNLWGFTASFIGAIEREFPSFLNERLPVDPLKCEFFLPAVVEAMISAGEAEVSVLASPDKWFGVTYRDDKPTVVAALADMHAAGTYPTPLWGSR